MQTPDPTVSSAGLYKLGLYTSGRLALGDETAPLAAPLRAAGDDMRAKALAREAAENDDLQAQTLVDHREGAHDRTLKAFVDAAYNACNRNRKHPRFERLFPKGTAALTLPRGDAQLAFSETYLMHLDGIAAAEPLVAEFRGGIADTLEGLRTAVLHRRETTAAVVATRTAELIARQTFCATYVATYGALIELTGSKVTAENYFRRYRNLRPNAADDSDIETAPSPAAEPPTV